MRAITYRRFGPADQVLEMAELSDPPPGPGEVAVDIAFSGVNPSDVKMRAGARAGVGALPFPVIVPHSDGAGVIAAVGEGVSSDRIGQRVWLWNGQWRRALGTAASRIVLPGQQAVPLPARVSLQTGACLGIPGLTACHTVFGGGPVDGATLLVQGGAGTVGFLAVQLARWGGARVIATARGDGLARAAEAGATQVLDYRDPDLAEQILAANGGRPVDRIVEVEFGANLATDTAVIAENGTIAAYGSARVMTPELPFYPLMFKAVNLDLVLVYLLDRARRDAAIARLDAALVQDALDCPIQEIHDLADCARAHQAVEAGARSGAVLVRCA